VSGVPRSLRWAWALALLALSGCGDDEPPVTTVESATPTGDTSAIDAGGAPVLVPPPDLSCGGLVGDSTCDPVTAWPCDTSSESCGYSAPTGAYVCYPIVDPAPVCGACDLSQGLYCAPGLACDRDTLVCTPFCCSDADCPRGRCQLDALNEDALASTGYCFENIALSCFAPDAGSEVDASAPGEGSSAADAGGEDGG
jgi:hypothetical protein